MLTGGAGTARGFQSEVIAFDDGAGISVGRAVWTDERGDRIFSRLTGDGMRAGRRIVGTITGGTGRYAGVEGEYAFEWQYVVDDRGRHHPGARGRPEGTVPREGRRAMSALAAVAPALAETAPPFWRRRTSWRGSPCCCWPRRSGSRPCPRG